MTLDYGYRSVVATVHDLDDRRHLVAVTIPHERIDRHGTSWGQHCWRDSFARRLPDMLREHDRRQQIGKVVQAESLGRESRLIGRFDDFSGNRHAERAFDDIREGRLRGWSWYFRNGRHEPHPSVPGALRYKSATMEELSAVRHPSLPSAHTVGLRSRGAEETNRLAEALRERFGITDIETEILAARLRERFGLTTTRKGPGDDYYR